MTNVTFRSCRAENIYEHGFYIAGSFDCNVTDCYVTNTSWDDGTMAFANPYGGTCAYKLAQGNPGLKIEGCTGDLQKTNVCGIGMLDAPLVSGPGGKFEISNCTFNINNTGQTALAGGSGTGATLGAALVSNLIVDAGPGYIGTMAIYLGTAANMEINGAHVLGTWAAAPIVMGASQGCSLRNVVIDGSTGWAIDLQNAISPTVENCRIVGGAYGITLGNSSGARLWQNRISVSTARYDLTGSTLSNYYIDDIEPITILNLHAGNRLALGSDVLGADKYFCGELQVVDSNGYYASFHMRGSKHYVRILTDPDSNYSENAGTSSRINVYWNTGGWYEIENNLTITVSVRARLDRLQEI